LQACRAAGQTASVDTSVYTPRLRSGEQSWLAASKTGDTQAVLQLMADDEVS